LRDTSTQVPPVQAHWLLPVPPRLIMADPGSHTV
jgi:hypothetical protein